MDFNQFILNIMTCFTLSFFVGLERQYRGRSLGLRTTILVSVGSFLFVCFSFLLYRDGLFDPTRVAAQVVSGIGFLGAGVIIKDGEKVHGLTTAATLWCDAAIGILCAAGYLKYAIIGTVIILFSNIVLRYVNRLINEEASKRRTIESHILDINCHEKDVIKIQKDINDFVINSKRIGIVVNSISISTGKISNVKFDFDINKTNEKSINRLLDIVQKKYDLVGFNYNKVKEKVNDEEEI